LADKDLDEYIGKPHEEGKREVKSKKEGIGSRTGKREKDKRLFGPVSEGCQPKGTDVRHQKSLDKGRRGKI